MTRASSPEEAMARNGRMTRSRLQAFLRIYIPEYMTPSTFVRVASLPLTPNGKVDRESLPQPTPQNTIADGAFEAARTVVEERVAALLADLLETERIGIHDNFFHLGGHSLLGAQVIARVRDVFEVDLSLRSLFEYPTIAGLAEILIQHEVAQADSALVTQMLADLEGLSLEEIDALLDTTVEEGW